VGISDLETAFAFALTAAVEITACDTSGKDADLCPGSGGGAGGGGGGGGAAGGGTASGGGGSGGSEWAALPLLPTRPTRWYVGI